MRIFRFFYLLGKFISHLWFGAKYKYFTHIVFGTNEKEKHAKVTDKIGRLMIRYLK